ncbi:MAG: hypothetical protein AB7G17_13285 [Phycisphaerales bacterium]
MKRLAWICITLLVVLAASWVYTAPRRAAERAQHLFSALVSAIPSRNVSELQGDGYVWQGHSVHLRFCASDADIDRIISRDYSPTSWEEIAHRFERPRNAWRYKPTWHPSSIAEKECYEWSQSGSEISPIGWGDYGWKYLVIDRTTGTVYFHAIGS